MNPTKITVIAIALIAIGVALIPRLMVIGEEGSQAKLGEVDCAGLWPTAFEMQGQRDSVSRAQTCELVKMIAAMKPTSEHWSSDTSDPWHYFGRMRILPKNDAWFLVFVARRSSGFHPLFSLRHRRGNGWAIVGQFDAEPLLRRLGVLDQLDRAKLMSNESLVPTDEQQGM